MTRAPYIARFGTPTIAAALLVACDERSPLEPAAAVQLSTQVAEEN